MEYWAIRISNTPVLQYSITPRSLRRQDYGKHTTQEIEII